MSDELWATRELCVDGACIGLIGADGLCRECGKVGRSAMTDPRLRQMMPTDPANPADPDGDPPAAALETDDRELCPDGSCLGVLDVMGRCRECGRDAGQPPREAATADASSSSAEPDGDFDDRRLCPDGGCIGLLGSDGKCKECGLLAPVQVEATGSR